MQRTGGCGDGYGENNGCFGGTGGDGNGRNDVSWTSVGEVVDDDASRCCGTDI